MGEDLKLGDKVVGIGARVGLTGTVSAISAGADGERRVTVRSTDGAEVSGVNEGDLRAVPEEPAAPESTE